MFFAKRPSTFISMAVLLTLVFTISPINLANAAAGDSDTALVVNGTNQYAGATDATSSMNIFIAKRTNQR